MAAEQLFDASWALAFERLYNSTASICSLVRGQKRVQTGQSEEQGNSAAMGAPIPGVELVHIARETNNVDRLAAFYTEVGVVV